MLINPGQQQQQCQWSKWTIDLEFTTLQGPRQLYHAEHQRSPVRVRVHLHPELEFGRSSLIMAIKPKNVDVFDVFAMSILAPTEALQVTLGLQPGTPSGLKRGQSR